MEAGKIGELPTRTDRLAGSLAARIAAVLVAVLALWLLLSPTAVAKKPPPPAKRTYFVIFLGIEGGYDSSAACLRFSGRRLCNLDRDICGVWEHDEVSDGQALLSFEIRFTEDDAEVVIDGTARTEDRFKRSSLGGAATLSIDGQTGNFALVGREVPPARCPALAEAFNSRAASD